MGWQVRNAANTIVQLEYGDDGMDPVCMEGRSGEPIALPRAMSVVKAMTPKAHAADLAPLPARLQAVVAVEIERMAGMQAASGAAAFCTAAFEDELMGYLQKQASCSCPTATPGPARWSTAPDLAGHVLQRGKWPANA